MSPAHRITYAFAPTRAYLEEVATPSGKRPILLSAYYLKFNTTKLEAWRRYNHPKLLLIDSGVYTFKAKLGYSIGTMIYNRLSPETQEHFQTEGLATIGDDIEAFATRYAAFLKEAEGLYDFAVDLDVDELVGLELAERCYEIILSQIPPERIIRVWHSTRPREDWIKWCKDPNIKYLAIEGGIQHRRDPDVYNRFINHSRRHGKRVHVFALTTRDFLCRVPLDTCDSSTFSEGARFGTAHIPDVGRVAFGERLKTVKHFDTHEQAQQEKVIEWLKAKGLSLDMMRESWEVRCLANLYYFDEVIDVPYRPRVRSYDLFEGDWV